MGGLDLDDVENVEIAEISSQDTLVTMRCQEMLEMMQRNIANSEIQVQCCIAMATLEEHGMEVECIRSLRVAMLAHPSVLLVQRLGCRALKYFSDDGASVQVEELFGVGLVHWTMQQYKSDAETQKWCCGLLRNLTLLHSARHQCVQLCVVQSLCSAMKAFPMNEELQIWCLGALNNLALSNDSCKEMLSLNGPGRVHSATRAFPNNVDIQKACGSLLQRLALNDGAYGQIAVIRTRSSDGRAQRNACKALANLSDDVCRRQRIVDLSGVDALKLAMRDHPKDIKVQQWGCKAMFNLAFDEDSRKEVGDFDGIRLIHGALWTFPKDLDVQRCGLGALSNLAQVDHIAQRIVDLNGIEAVFGAMKEFDSDPLIQEFGLSALAKLARGEDNLLKMRYLDTDSLLEHATKVVTDEMSRTLAATTKSKLSTIQRPNLPIVQGSNASTGV